MLIDLLSTGDKSRKGLLEGIDLYNKTDNFNSLRRFLLVNSKSSVLNLKVYGLRYLSCVI